MIGKKGQEEMVGFVMIVIIVAVVFLVFLGIFLRQDSGKINTDSKEIYQFLESSMEYTSDCAIGHEPAFSKMGGLVKDCHEGKLCVSGKSACEVLNSTMTEILGISWKFSSDNSDNSDNGNSYYEGYEFSSVYDSEEIIFEIKEGNCEDGFIGAEYPIPRKIISSFKLCF